MAVITDLYFIVKKVSCDQISPDRIIFSCMISKENSYISLSNENSRRKILLFFLSTTALFPTRRSSAKTKNKNPYDERRLLEQNKRRQKENNAPDDFPSFVREGMYQAAIPWFN